MKRLFTCALAAALLSWIHYGLATDLDLTSRVAAWLERQRTPWSQQVEPSRLAVAVTSAAPDRRWAALLLTIANHESRFRAAIAAGQCGPHECDDGRAWGLWQQHRTAANGAVWGSPDPTVQARAASDALRGLDAMCRRTGVPFPLSVLRAYGTGRGCRARLKDERQRVATYERIMKGL